MFPIEKIPPALETINFFNFFIETVNFITIIAQQFTGNSSHSIRLILFWIPLENFIFIKLKIIGCEVKVEKPGLASW